MPSNALLSLVALLAAPPNNAVSTPPGLPVVVLLEQDPTDALTRVRMVLYRRMLVVDKGRAGDVPNLESIALGVADGDTLAEAFRKDWLRADASRVESVAVVDKYDLGGQHGTASWVLVGFSRNLVRQTWVKGLDLARSTASNDRLPANARKAFSLAERLLSRKGGAFIPLRGQISFTDTKQPAALDCRWPSTLSNQKPQRGLALTIDADRWVEAVAFVARCPIVVDEDAAWHPIVRAVLPFQEEWRAILGN